MKRTTVIASLLATFVGTIAVACVPPPQGGPCNLPATPGTTTHTITVDGLAREYLVSVPATYSATQRVPLVFNFHGAGATMQQQDIYSAMSTKAGAKGWIVVTPQGRTFSGTTAWVLPALSDVDVHFVSAMLVAVGSTLCVDTARVFTTGMSNGAGFSDALLCALPGTFAASAPVAGVNISRVCGNGTPHAAVLAFHGTADPVVHYDGGPVGGSPLALPPVEDAVGRWAAFDGCNATPVTTTIASDVTHRTYSDCQDGAGVELYSVLGGGHTWPGSAIDVPLGPTTHSIDATALMLQFFALHPKRV
jgi:polyhydroxybutyrate depolymerase